LTDLSEEEQMMKEAGYFLRALTARDWDLCCSFSFRADDCCPAGSEHGRQ
jgi:hypothetical protein